MAQEALSNRERDRLRKVTPKPPRKVAGEAVVRAAPAPPPVDAAKDKDGLAWLISKNKLTDAQVQEALDYEQGVLDAGEVALQSSLGDPDRVRTAAGSGSPGVAVASMTAARRYLLVARYVVLRGQVDLLTVMDGVCGRRFSLRFLAGGDKHRAAELLVSLRIALDLLVAYRAGPPAVAKIDA